MVGAVPAVGADTDAGEADQDEVQVECPPRKRIRLASVKRGVRGEWFKCFTLDAGGRYRLLLHGSFCFFPLLQV